jgi:hypothetical protein
MPARASISGRGHSAWRLEFWALDRLIPSPRNARTHSDAQVAEFPGGIRASDIEQHFFTRS